MSLLGIDVGTSGCKAAVFSETGRLLALAYEEYDVVRAQPGWAELAVGPVWEQIQRTVRQAVAAAAGAADREDPVTALAVSSMGEALVPVTHGRRVRAGGAGLGPAWLGPSLLNFDSRGSEYLADLRAALPVEWLYRINGNTLGDQYSLLKLRWIKDHQPDLYRQADTFLLWGGFVPFMLGVEPFVDYSLANRTLLFDLDAADWSDELLAVAGLDRAKLPRPVPTGTVMGEVARQTAETLGLPPGVLVVAGGHDQCINGVGCGAIAAGQAMYGMGTYICMMPVFNRRPDPAAMIGQGLNTEHHAVPGHYVSFIYNHGGSLLRWFRDTFAGADRAAAQAAGGPVAGGDIYAALIAEMPDAPSRVMALPHWAPTGPPEYISDSSGVLAGLKLDTPRGEILKGILEGVTFYERACLEALPAAGITITDLRAVGGGSRSDAWIQLSADILGRPFIRPKVTEAGVLGAAIVAGVGSGVFPSLAAGVETMVQAERIFEPNPSKQQLYEQRFAQYQRLGPLMREYLREA